MDWTKVMCEKPRLQLTTDDVHQCNCIFYQHFETSQWILLRHFAQTNKVKLFCSQQFCFCWA